MDQITDKLAPHLQTKFLKDAQTYECKILEQHLQKAIATPSHTTTMPSGGGSVVTTTHGSAKE
jgi:hypothetical protein